MTTLLYTLWVLYTVGTLCFFLFWGTLFVTLVRTITDSGSPRKITKIPKKDTRELLLEIDERTLRD